MTRLHASDYQLGATTTTTDGKRGTVGALVKAADPGIRRLFVR